MRISASEFILFCNPPAQNVETLSKIVPEVELMVDGDAWDYGKNGWEEQVRQLKGSAVPFTVHPPAWDVNVAAPIRALREAGATLNKMSLELCKELGAKQMVYHPGYYDSDSAFSKSRARNFSYGLLEELVDMAKPLGVTLAFENIAGPAATLFDQEEFIHALDHVDPCVKYLLDVGHAHMNGWDIPYVIDALADRLCGLHLHDNDGKGDAHLPIGKGTIPWMNVFQSMKKISPECIFILEYATNTPLSALAEGRDLLLKHVQDA